MILIKFKLFLKKQKNVNLKTNFRTCCSHISSTSKRITPNPHTSSMYLLFYNIEIRDIFTLLDKALTNK